MSTGTVSHQPFMPDGDWKRLVRAVAARKYHLLLGAGASLGARGGDNEFLPTGPQLAGELLRRFGFGDEADSNEHLLHAVWEVISDQTDSTGRSPVQYLADRFTNCRPSWQGELLTLRWQRIWTLNIDDVIQQAFDGDREVCSQDLTTLVWNDRYADIRLGDRHGRESVQVIHLHGYAPRLPNLKTGGEHASIVFSIREYLKAADSRHVWHRIFHDEFIGQPFLILGARLVDEYDLNSALSCGSSSLELLGLPSVAVLARPDAVTRQRLDRNGVVVVDADARSFIERLRQDVDEFEQTQSLGRYALGSRQHELRVLEQFRPLDPQKPSIERRSRDFYDGVEPEWIDVVKERDVVFQATLRLVRSIAESVPDSDVPTCAWLVTGRPGSGKSVALLRLGRELVSLGYEVFSFRNEQRLNVDAVVAWLRQSLHTRRALLFDNAGDSAMEIGALVDSVISERLQAIVCMAERRSRQGVIFDGVRTDNLQVVELERLHRVDASLLIDKLNSVGRLGVITPMSREGQIRYFCHDSHGDLLVGLFGLEGNRSFADRLISEYENDTGSQLLRDVYLVVSIIASTGNKTELSLVELVTGFSGKLVIQEVERVGEPRGLFSISEGRLTTRHRRVAETLIKVVVDRSVLYSTMLAIMTQLAPYVNQASVSLKTVPARIARTMLDADYVRDILGALVVEQWYEDLSDRYGWSGRFWEQRALASLANRAYAKAYSYAYQAVKRKRDLFSLNTLGTVTLAMAVHYDRAGVEAAERYSTAVQYLHEARAADEASTRRLGSPYPFVTFFRYSLEYGRVAASSGLLTQEMAHEWDQWYTAAKRMSVFQSGQYRHSLDRWHEKWLKLVIAQGKSTDMASE
ncbi:MAG: SIR2 family protein [Ardenticatenia bacterium]|nr:SIR2 family protein [Ardenticatenia bacterium]